MGLSKRSDLVVGTENFLDLVSNDSLNVCTAITDILTGIEMIRMLCEMLTDTCCHAQTEVGVDVDLADCELSCLTELLLRNTDSIRHLTAELVDDLNVLLRYGRRTVENDRESGDSLHALFENVESERRRYKDALLVSCALIRCELVSTVRSTDSDSEGVNACSGNEFLNLFRTCVRLVTGLNLNVILDTCESSELSLNDYAVIMSILCNLLGLCDILFEAVA